MGEVRTRLPNIFEMGEVRTLLMTVVLKRKKQKARPKGVNLKVRWRAKVAMRYRSEESNLCVLLKRKKAESEAQRGKPKGTLESESRNAIVQ